MPSFWWAGHRAMTAQPGRCLASWHPASMLVHQQAGFDKAGSLQTDLNGSLVLLLHRLHSVQALAHGQHEGQQLLLESGHLSAVLLLQGGTESLQVLGCLRF